MGNKRGRRGVVLGMDYPEDFTEARVALGVLLQRRLPPHVLYLIEEAFLKLELAEYWLTHPQDSGNMQ